MRADAFQERLRVSLALTLAGNEHRVAPGNVRAFALALHPWGLEGQVEFLVADEVELGGQQKDEVLADFLLPDLARVSLEIQVVQADAKKQATPVALKVEGWVEDKTVEELPVTTQSSVGVSYRRYGVRFCDAARLLWRQHHPCKLYTQKSFQEVLEEHKGEHVALAYDWSGVVDAPCPQLFVGLEAAQGGASFYDFVMWYVHRHAGVFCYDHAAKQYRLSATKDSAGEPKTLRAEEVRTLRMCFPETIRHEVNVLNSRADAPGTEAVAQPQAVAGLRQDVLLRTPLTDEVQARVEREKALLVARGLELALDWCRFPLEALTPGVLVKLPAHAPWGEGVPADETFRIRHVLLRGESPWTGPDDEHDAPDAEYQVSLGMRLERKDEAWVELPEWVPPTFPWLAEGFIVSEEGEEKDETWQAYTDDNTSLDRFKVRMPLWEDQVVALPFEPILLPGHFYFPAYKGERVLVALDFQQAWLERYLDWRAGARLPLEGQGTHLLVGKSTESHTSLSHFYEEGKPVLRLLRTHEKDTVTVKLREGGVLLHVEEEK